MNNKYPTTKPSLNLDFANTKSLDPRITFRRGTPGTYYDGVTHAKAEENLLKHSENFTDSLWSKLGTSLETTTEIAPDGSQNAYFLKQNSANSQHAIYARDLADLGKTYSISIYAKAGAVSRILFASVFTSEHVLYDLSSGEFERYTYSSKLIKSYNMESVGNGWYRCSIVYESATSDNGIGLYLLDDNDEASFVGDNSSGVYIWGAQLEQRDTVTSYTATNGTPITKYQPKLMTAAADTARFDHDPITGESKGLLIEESRTNLLTYSQDFGNAVWGKWNSALIPNTIVAPDGTLTGSKFTEDGSTWTYHYLRRNANPMLSLNTTYTYSVYAKAAERTIMRISMYDGAGFADAKFDLSGGTVFSTDLGTAGIESVGNGWYRCYIMGTSNAANNAQMNFVDIYTCDDNGSDRYDGDGRSGLYIWGAQLETGSFSTSYIKTTGASATRSADNASITGENFSSWYRQDEGSIYCEAAKMNPVTSVIASLNDGTSNNRIFINLRSGENFEVTKSNNQEVLSGYTGLNAETYYKIAACYKKDSAAMSLGGQNSLSDTDCEVPGVDRLLFSKNYSSNVLYDYSMYIKKLAYYPQRLTNEQLQNLTK